MELLRPDEICALPQRARSPPVQQKGHRQYLAHQFRLVELVLLQPNTE